MKDTNVAENDGPTYQFGELSARCLRVWDVVWREGMRLALQLAASKAENTNDDQLR